MTEVLLHKSRRALVPLLMVLVPCAALFAAPLASGAPGDINTIAGTGVEGNSGDGGPASSAELRLPYGVALDGDGNLYIVDRADDTVRRIDSSGTITTVAGMANAEGFSGDGGPATSAELDAPNGVAVDDSGNVYIADQANQRIRKVDTSGTITTVAGSGATGFGNGGYSGDGGPATSATLNEPTGVAVDSSGNLYIADYINGRIRKVDTAGTITTVAGYVSGVDEGDGHPATTVHLDHPYDAAIDDAGNLYVAELGNNRIRKVDTAGTITTVAGSGPGGVGSFSGDGGPATSAELDRPTRVEVDATGNLYIVDTYNHRVRMVDTSGTITTVAGSGAFGEGNGGFSGDGGAATSARLNRPWGLAVDGGAGNLYIADSENLRVRKVELPRSSASEDVPAGGTVSTNTTTTPADPVGTSVTTPVAGTVTIAEGPTTTPDPSGYSLLGQQVEITAPDASAADPLVLSFLLDASLLPSGADEDTVEVFRNGTVIADCDAGAGSSASPDPCVATRAATGSGIELTVRTSHASSWNFGLAVPPQTTITSGPSGTINDPTPTLGFASSLASSSFACKLDSGAYSACTSPRTTARLADGSHTFYVRATKNGVTDATPASRTFTVKTAAVSRSGSTLTVTAAPGAKDNLVITKPSASTLRIADPLSGPYTGSGVHAGAGCTQDGDNAATCAGAAMVTLINVTAGDQTDKVTNSTTIKVMLDGGTQDDVLQGGSAADTLMGAAGSDTLKGMGGNDLLKARDLASDTLIDCGIGTDKADLDTLPKDPNSVVTNCETKTRH